MGKVSLHFVGGGRVEMWVIYHPWVEIALAFQLLLLFSKVLHLYIPNWELRYFPPSKPKKITLVHEQVISWDRVESCTFWQIESHWLPCSEYYMLDSFECKVCCLARLLVCFVAHLLRNNEDVKAISCTAGHSRLWCIMKWLDVCKKKHLRTGFWPYCIFLQKWTLQLSASPTTTLAFGILSTENSIFQSSWFRSNILYTYRCHHLIKAEALEEGNTLQETSIFLMFCILWWDQELYVA